MLRYPSQMAFLAIQTRVWQLNRWPCHSLADSLTHWVSVLISPSKSNPRHLWPFRHLIRVMNRQDPTKKLGTFWGLLEDFLGTFWGLFGDFLRTFWGLFGDFWGLFEVFLELFWFFWNFLTYFTHLPTIEIFWGLFGPFLRTYWGLFGNILGNFMDL